MKRVIAALGLILWALPASYAQQPVAPDNDADTIDEITVTGVRERLYNAGTLKDVIQKTEIVDEHMIASRRALNLSQAIQTSPGVRVSNECSMCGVKRIMLNGMRGEHTTILTDGMPLHTMIAGYYAVDALATTGIKSIEVARGAGASLIAPEAIGGTLNIISKEPDVTGLDMDAAYEEGGGYHFGGLGSIVSQDGRHAFTIAAQFDGHDAYDGDDNGVSEEPLQDNSSVVLRLSSDLGPRDNVTIRTAFIDGEIFGGPMSVDSIGGVLATFDGIESAQLFVDDDVRNTYIGAPWETAEWIKTERVEISASWLHEFSSRFNSTFGVGYSEHEQDSFYEGFDYAATDDLVYVDLRNNFVVNDRHLLTFGIDQRDEEMRSESVAGEASANYIEDSFDYLVRGIYLQDTWTPTDRFEIAVALRIDSVEADFVAPEKPGTEIDETIAAPRIDARYTHNERWASRFSVGRGYRAPLSFFETDHGILDAGDGFAIDIDRLEESLSTTYALSYEGERLSSTLSLAHTRVDYLASMDETPTGVPLLTQLDGDATVFATDLALTYDLRDDLAISGTIELFDYDEAFESSYAIAPIEERVTASLDYMGENWNVFASVIWIGSRDLTRYGYEGFNIIGGPPKSTDAESFATFDFKVTRELTDTMSLYLGATNLFDENQAGDMDSPLFFDADGGYDVGYIYGPLRGREVYAGVSFSL